MVRQWGKKEKIRNYYPNKSKITPVYIKFYLSNIDYTETYMLYVRVVYNFKPALHFTVLFGFIYIPTTCVRIEY